MLYDNIQESIAHLRKFTASQPKFGIILGTGLGNLTDHIDVEVEIPYRDIPHFPVSTVQSHKGKLVFGKVYSRYKDKLGIHKVVNTLNFN